MRQERKTIGNAAAETKGRHARWRPALRWAAEIRSSQRSMEAGARERGVRVHTRSRGQPRAIRIGVRE